MGMRIRKGDQFWGEGMDFGVKLYGMLNRIASDDPDAGSQPWSEIRTRPGRLFFVGDPKQSIYRFRRADVALFLEARNSFAEEPVRLSTNFRTVTPVIDWINGVFGELIRHEPGRQPSRRQRTYAVNARMPKTVRPSSTR